MSTTNNTIPIPTPIQCSLLLTAWSDSQWDIYYQYADFGEMDISQSGIVKNLDGHFTGQVHFIGTSYSF
ncbi:hypothetical protein AB4259_06490 [Vibrio amylolyticus]|uniref:hypothetical protein n=1 Tax=Vibrio TaxID=662 RepID=UPI000C822850|nr:hypothetical protein [Vibrio sp. 10N.261.55.A7]PMJ91495.1 hypothetical protein BCU12_09835 [Vibrio sp. 10N.261.55.A7]